MMTFQELGSSIGATGFIALILSFFFAGMSLVNAWRRHRQAFPPPPRTGPIQLTDPRSGAPVGIHFPTVAAQPEPAPVAAGEADPAPPQSPPAAETGNRFFRQLDARGLDVDTTRGITHDDYLWE